jgi:hypothetical protein
MSNNPHYDAVLADLRQMKEDAQDGIRAIERLISRASVNSAPKPAGGVPGSVANRVIAFLESQNGRAVRTEEIYKALAPVNMKTLRGTLSRLATDKKIGKHGRGKYRAARRTREESTPSS